MLEYFRQAFSRSYGIVLIYDWLRNGNHQSIADDILSKSTLILSHKQCIHDWRYKKPRELSWMTGIILAITTVSFSVTGYSFPWDQIGYWACKIVTAVPEALDNLIPGIGKILVTVLRAGDTVSQCTLTISNSGHTFVLPVMSPIFILLHFTMLRKQGIWDLFDRITASR